MTTTTTTPVPEIAPVAMPTFTMTSISAGTPSLSMIGELFQFRIAVEFSPADAEQAGDFSLHMFSAAYMEEGMEIEGPGPASLHLWSDSYTVGSVIQGDFSSYEHHKPYLSHVHDGLTISATGLHTEGRGPDGTSLSVSLSTSIVPSQHMNGWYATDAVNVTQTLFATSDFHNRSYVWVGMEELALDPDETPHTQAIYANHSHACGGAGPCYYPIRMRETQLVELSLYSSISQADYTLTVLESKGRPDVFFISEPSVQLGSSYSGYAQSNIYLAPMPPSSSGLLQTTGWDVILPGLVNHGLDREDVNGSSNQIRISFLLTLLDNPDYFPGDSHAVSVEIKAKPAAMLTCGEVLCEPVKQTETIDFIQMEENVAGGEVPTLVNTSAPVSAYQGDTVPFFIFFQLVEGDNLVQCRVSCPAAAGVYPVGARLSDSPAVGYIPPDWSVADGLGTGVVNWQFGLVNSRVAGQVMRMKLLLQVDKDESVVGSHTCSVSGLGDSTVELAIDIAEQLAPADGIHARLAQLVWDSAVGSTDQFAMDVQLTIPQGFGGEDFTVSFESRDESGSAHSIQLCSVEITPYQETCLRKITESQLTYSSTDVQMYKDRGNVSIGQTCPSNATGSSISISGIFQIPPIGVPTAHEKLLARVQFSNNSVWSAEETIGMTASASYSSEGAYSWAECVGGWAKVTNKKQLCYVPSPKTWEESKIFCKKLGGNLAEIMSGLEFDKFSIWIYNMQKNEGSFTSPFFVGGIVRSGDLVWDLSDVKVQIYPNGFINTEEGDSSWESLENGSILSFETRNIDELKFLSKSMLQFEVVPKLTADIGGNFVCMKEGNGQTILAPTIQTMQPVDLTIYGKPTLIKYLIKFPEKFSSPLKFLVESNSMFKICKMEVLDTGANLPCHRDRLDKGWAGDFNSSRLQYIRGGGKSPYNRAYSGNQAELSFDKLFNWGSGKYSKNKSPDRNSLLVGVYVMGEDRGELNTSVTEMKHTLTSYIGAAAHEQTGSTAFQSSSGAAISTSIIESNIEVIPSDGNFEAEKWKCKRIKFSYSANKYARGSLVVENLSFGDGKYITWCGLFLTKIGSNHPCINPTHTTWIFCRERNDFSCEKVNNHNQTEFWASIRMDVRSGYETFSNDPEEDKLEFELSFLPDKELQAGTSIDIKINLCTQSYAICHSNGIYLTKTFTVTIIEQLSVLQPSPSPHLKYWHKYLNQPAFVGESEQTVQPAIRQRVNRHIRFSFPHKSTLPFQTYVRSPVEQSRPFLHLTKIEFDLDRRACGDCLYGTLGGSAELLLDRIYGVQYLNTDRTHTHMQTDAIFTDFGHMTNPGYWGDWGPHTDREDQVRFLTTVEVTDHPGNVDGAMIYLETALRIGDEIITRREYQRIVVNREETKDYRREAFRAKLTIDAAYEEIKEPLEEFSTVSVSSIIKHDPTSKGEAYPASVRVILDDFTGIDQDIIFTNYTVADVSIIVTDATENHGGFIDIVFPNGIMFPDIIELNFTIILDPLRKRRSEVSMVNTVILSATCHVFPHASYPALNPVQCSEHRTIKIPNKRTCNTTVSFEYASCQISGSGVRGPGSEYSVLNVINDTLAWSAPIREGPRWNPWVEFDFLGVRTITRIKLNNLEQTRATVEVRVDYGSSQTSMEKGEIIEVNKNELKLSKPLKARIIRLVIVMTNDVTPSLKAITLHQVQFIGCPAEETMCRETMQSRGTKPLRQKKSKYCANHDIERSRHYAVDTVNGMIIYFCDKDMYRDKDMACFSSSDDGKTWTGLPNYVQRIIGFSQAKGRMYLQDTSGLGYLSSLDGRRLDVVHSSSLPDMTGMTWQPSIMVEGDGEKMFGPNWGGSTVVGGYGGIFVGGIKTVDWSSCCRK